MEDDPRLLQLAELAEVGLAAASLAHELRQPLFAIKGIAQVGRARGAITGDELDGLLAAVEHLDALVGAWRPIGRAEAPQLYDLRAAALDATRLLEGPARRAATELVVEERAPLWLTGSPAVARQVAINLTRNALDAVRDRPTRRVSIRFLCGERPGFEVADTGPGLPAGRADELFQPFVTTKGDGGTGLGLYVSRALCEAAGGELTLTSTPAGTVATAILGHAAAAVGVEAQPEATSDEGAAALGAFDPSGGDAG